MTARARSVAACALVLASACASTPQGRMHRALDPSMERVLRAESYLRTVAGISSNLSRLTRSDGFIYTADVAPALRYLAEVQDTARFRDLRRFVTGSLLRRGPAGLDVALRYRADYSFEPATMYGRVWTARALADGWRLLGDTASALALAQLAPFDRTVVQNQSAMVRLTSECGDAVDVVQSDPAPARAVLAQAKQLVGSRKAAKEHAARGSTAGDGEVPLLSCLTSVSVALKDPDATVRYLEDLLGHIQPMLSHSGRPDLGTSADVLLTLRRVREAGPQNAW